MLESGAKLSEPQFLSLKRQLKAEKNLAFRVGSGSMAPVIKEGELVLVAEAGTPEKFDILVFFHKTKLICHLLKRVNTSPAADGQRTFVTGGLKNLRKEDRPITSDQILGKVISHKVSWAIKARVTLSGIWR